MKTRIGVSNAAFAGTVVVLVILAGIGFSLYFTSSSGSTTTNNMTETMIHTVTTSSNVTDALQFTAASGQMVHSAWLLIEPTGSGDYAVSVYAQGLESTGGTGNTYIVEATQSSGSMSVVPIGANETASEFGTTTQGVGSYLTVLMQNPFSSFENVQIVYLPGMQMANATVVATATLSMASH
ncbi:MAG TPA: hypothetical protein VEH01_01955 [Nitrososphaerales archaeon]|nr:hypothetical protein [Nitrososphaerales archaeon]